MQQIRNKLKIRFLYLEIIKHEDIFRYQKKFHVLSICLSVKDSILKIV